MSKSNNNDMPHRGNFFCKYCAMHVDMKKQATKLFGSNCHTVAQLTQPDNSEEDGTEDNYVTFDSKDNTEFRVMKQDRSLRIFCELEGRPQYMDVSNKSTQPTCLISTVIANKTNVSEHNYSQATLATQIQKSIEQPGALTF